MISSNVLFLHGIKNHLLRDDDPANGFLKSNGFLGKAKAGNDNKSSCKFTKIGEEDHKDNAIVNPRDYDSVHHLTNIIRSLVSLEEEPTIGIICGSGLGGLGDFVSNKKVLPFTQIPGFPKTNVLGHKGNLIFGHLNGKYVVCMQGRFHPYEHDMDLVLCSMPVRIMHFLGVKRLIVSNAAGGVNPAFEVGDMMLIKDHIFMPGLSGFSPLIGIDLRFGPRFVSMHNTYDCKLRKTVLQVAKELDIPIKEGVYVMSGGPQYESPAECFLYKCAGADALGMSTCHEVTVAIQCQMKVIGFSLITNISKVELEESMELSHEEVLKVGGESTDKFCELISAIVGKI